MDGDYSVQIIFIVYIGYSPAVNNDWSNQSVMLL